jgi:hypothetical protein
MPGVNREQILAYNEDEELDKSCSLYRRGVKRVRHAIKRAGFVFSGSEEG